MMMPDLPAAIHESEQILRTCPGIVVQKTVIAPPNPESKNILLAIPNADIPEELIRIFETTERCEFSWKDPTGAVFGKEFRYGGFTLLSPSEIKQQLHELREIAREAHEKGWDVDDPGYAALVRDWPHWLPVFAFDNGDCFSIDMSDKSFPVVFQEHDVMDGGPKRHGLRIAPDLKTLIERWSQILFVECDWSLITDESGIKPWSVRLRTFENCIRKHSPVAPPVKKDDLLTKGKIEGYGCLVCTILLLCAFFCCLIMALKGFDRGSCLIGGILAGFFIPTLLLTAFLFKLGTRISETGSEPPPAPLYSSDSLNKKIERCEWPIIIGTYLTVFLTGAVATMSFWMTSHSWFFIFWLMFAAVFIAAALFCGYRVWHSQPVTRIERKEGEWLAVPIRDRSFLWFDYVMKMLGCACVAGSFFLCFKLIVPVMLTFSANFSDEFTGTVQNIEQVRGGYSVTTEDRQRVKIGYEWNPLPKPGDRIEKKKNSFCYLLNRKNAGIKEGILSFNTGLSTVSFTLLNLLLLTELIFFVFYRRFIFVMSGAYEIFPARMFQPMPGNPIDRAGNLFRIVPVISLWLVCIFYYMKIDEWLGLTK